MSGNRNLSFIFASDVGVRVTTIFAAFESGTRNFVAAESLHDGIFTAGQEKGTVLVQQSSGHCSAE
jgi:hypothetical protein